MESDSSAKAGSKASRGALAYPLVLFLAESRSDEREEGRRGVVGREAGCRVAECERLALGLLGRGVVVIVFAVGGGGDGGGWGWGWVGG